MQGAVISEYLIAMLFVSVFAIAALGSFSNRLTRESFEVAVVLNDDGGGTASTGGPDQTNGDPGNLEHCENTFSFLCLFSD